jgi:hypothetical protein
MERRWDEVLPRFTYVLLNPSGAGGDRDDRTSRRLHALTAANGGGGFAVVNLFTVVDTSQQRLHDPAAPGEAAELAELDELADEWIAMAAQRSEVLVLGWGDGNATGPRGAAHRARVRRRAGAVWPLVRPHRPGCFTRNASGSPGHPLYLRTTSTVSAYAPTAGYLGDGRSPVPDDAVPTGEASTIGGPAVPDPA